MPSRPLIYFGIPHLDTIAPEVLPSVLYATQGRCEVDANRAGTDERGNVIVEPLRSATRISMGMMSASLHGQCFNSLWCAARNGPYQKPAVHYAKFVMHHSDLGACEPGWLDRLYEIQEQTGADVVSVVVPIKDMDGVTSTAIARKANLADRRRVTMTELYARDRRTGEYLLPETFGIEDLERAWNLTPGEHYLYLNTGLWICPMDRPWVKKFPGFNVVTGITNHKDGTCSPHCMPEDWHFSLWAQRHGLKVMATRAVKLGHFGRTRFHNEHPWGKMPTDMAGPTNSERAKKMGIEMNKGY